MKRILGLFAVLGGALGLIAPFSDYLPSGNFVEVLYITTDLSLLLGLIGMYFIHQESISVLGFCGFLIAAASLAFVSGPDASLFGVDTYVMGAPLIGFGLVLFSIAQMQSAITNWAAPMILIVSVIIGGIAMATPSLPILFVLSGILFGIAFVINGLSVMKHS